ncbi:MAG: fatty acyl-AMP ligase [Solirubrobacteraceae bacterium]
MQGAVTMVDVCRRRSMLDDTRVGYAFEADGDEPPRELTFGDLDRSARAVAATLAEHVEPGSRALLNYSPGLDFLIGFFGCLYAGVIAIPAAPIEGRRPDSALTERCRAIVDSAEPAVVLSVGAMFDRIDPGTLRCAGLDGCRAIATDEIDGAAAKRWQPPAIDAATVAYLQYSSGSTGTPKGVMLTHANVLHNIAAIRGLCADGPDVVGAFWLPMFHDMGLVASAFMPVLVGRRATLMSPVSFLQQPYRWLSALSQPRSVSAAPNFAYDLCVDRVSDRQLARLDLSGWGCAIVGAERVRPATLARFAQRFSACGFRAESFAPCYGLAESTLLVTGGPVARRPTVRSFAVRALAGHEVRSPTADEPAVSLVGCGTPRPGVHVLIADPDTLRRCEPGRIGEVCIASPSVGAGYWNRPNETSETFGVTVEGAPGRFLRTGDLGTVIDGELFVSGRRKDLVIVDGHNHYPPDLEATAETAHPALRRGFCAVVSVDDGLRERVVVLAEISNRGILTARTNPSRRGADGAPPTDLDLEITTAIRSALSAGHGVSVDEVVLLRPGSLPLTSSAKLQRFACRAGYAAGRFDVRRVDLSAAPVAPAATEAAA